MTPAPYRLRPGSYFPVVDPVMADHPAAQGFVQDPDGLPCGSLSWIARLGLAPATAGQDPRFLALPVAGVSTSQDHRFGIWTLACRSWPRIMAHSPRSQNVAG